MFLLDIASNLAHVTGNLTLGYIVKDDGYFWAYVASAVFFVLAFFYSVSVVKETVHGSVESYFFSIEHVQRSWSLYTKDDENNRRWKLQACVNFFETFNL